MTIAILSSGKRLRTFSISSIPNLAKGFSTSAAEPGI